MPDPLRSIALFGAVFLSLVQTAKGEESKGESTHHGGLRLTLEASLSALHFKSKGSADNYQWDQSASGVGPSVRVGGIWAPSLNTEERGVRFWPGLRFGLGLDFIATHFSTDSTDAWYLPPETIRDRSWQRVLRIPAYFGVQAAIGRTQADGSWHGLMMGVNYEPMLVFNSSLVSYNEPFFLRSVSFDLTVLNLDPHAAKPQFGLRITVTPPMRVDDQTNPSDNDHVFDPWMVSASIGVSWF